MARRAAGAARLLAERYGLKADTVRRYALRLKSHTFTGVRGRPRAAKTSPLASAGQNKMLPRRRLSRMRLLQAIPRTMAKSPVRQ